MATTSREFLAALSLRALAVLPAVPSWRALDQVPAGGLPRRKRKALISLLVSTILASCATPYGDNLGIDYSQKQIPGSITVSDAKLYRREALINERRREVLYIDQLMAKTETDGFVIGSDIAREIEVIQSLALKAGLSVDPAAGRAYRDTSETAAIQQDINVLQLQLQLDQLKRDAALFRERLGAQTDPSRSDLGAPAVGTGPTTPTALTPADTKDLIERIDDLQTVLANRLGADIKGPRSVSGQGNPIDQFRDRAAYRQILTTARNAASLDELHDLNGTALYRLTFQVTTLPPPEMYLRSAGLVEMSPAKTRLDRNDPEMVDIYGRWLEQVNQVLIEAKADDPARLEIQSLFAASELFDVVQLLYDDGSSAPKPAVASKKSDTKPAAPVVALPTCTPGLAPYGPLASTCGRLVIAVPRLPASSVSFSGENRTMRQVLGLDIPRLYGNYDRDLPKLTDPNILNQLLEPGKCALRSAEVRGRIDRRSDAGLADTLVSAAVSASTGIQSLTQAVRRLARYTGSEQQVAALSAAQEMLLGVSERASVVLGSLAAGRCAAGETLLPAQPVVVPGRFSKLVVAANNVRVYEVGPREQVQQVSTAARAAEAFGLAMALTATAPSTGASVNAGLGYSRSAMGKVDAVERLPVVVGFAQAGGKWEDSIDGRDTKQPHFGWILGPRINTVNTKNGTLDLEQGQRSYDLSADLAVSGWRTKLTLAIRTAWSPDWRSRDFVSALAPTGPVHHVTVNLRPSADEFAALTTQLAAAGLGQRFVSIRSIKSQKIKACAATTLIIEGENLWRATDVIIGGKRIGGDGLAVMPDMRGITVEIPAKTSYADPKIDVQVLTPFGVAHSREPLVIDGYDSKGCDKPEALAEGPAVTGVAPEMVNVCSSPIFTLTGRDLDKLTSVQFGQHKGALAVVAAKAKGKERQVSFTREQLAQIATEFESMQFFVSEKALGNKAIRVVSRNCTQGKE